MNITDEQVSAYKAAYMKHFTDSLDGVVVNGTADISFEATRSGLAAVMSAIEPAGVGVGTPPPSTHVAGAAAIRKVGDAAVQKLVDRFALTHFMPDSDELTDYLRSIVDACVKAATERQE